MRAYLNAAYHCWAANKIFNSRCSKTAILSFLKSFEKPFKSQSFSTCFWCFISFTNQISCLTRWKFRTSGRYFAPCIRQPSQNCLVHVSSSLTNRACAWVVRKSCYFEIFRGKFLHFLSFFSSNNDELSGTSLRLNREKYLQYSSLETLWLITSFLFFVFSFSHVLFVSVSISRRVT